MSSVKTTNEEQIAIVVGQIRDMIAWWKREKLADSLRGMLCQNGCGTHFEPAEQYQTYCDKCRTAVIEEMERFALERKAAEGTL